MNPYETQRAAFLGSGTANVRYYYSGVLLSFFSILFNLKGIWHQALPLL